MGRVVFATGFVLLLFDGAAAIWLGQILGRRLLVVTGILLVAAAAGLVVVWRRWSRAIAEVDAARAELAAEVLRLRDAVARARERRDRGN
jgi:hypothetical protein